MTITVSEEKELGDYVSIVTWGFIGPEHCPEDEFAALALNDAEERLDGVLLEHARDALGQLERGER